MKPAILTALALALGLACSTDRPAAPGSVHGAAVELGGGRRIPRPAMVFWNGPSLEGKDRERVTIGGVHGNTHDSLLVVQTATLGPIQRYCGRLSIAWADVDSGVWLDDWSTIARPPQMAVGWRSQARPPPASGGR